MKKLNFIIGALGGAMTGYLLSNEDLRKKLSKAKNHGEAAKILGKELQRSGKKVAKEAKELIEKDDVHEKFGEWKTYFLEEGEKLGVKAKKAAKKTAKNVKKKAAKSCKKACKKAKSKLKK
ncbi:hypothetical protein HOF56_03450 [Candidatus Peribacteria bacterium]|nr:hypothetical protein [Candidatus Peribacteria bacterium]MBT4021071.1 hypothetical protein [Candidatus Peribacteria bacterium]MBT4240792.1 hypothetical protein [Candidatus Peribacteria bacterium]MBT4474179.1 hypothetical protein [Candidatus Peribacteria bacterium]